MTDEFDEKAREIMRGWEILAVPHDGGRLWSVSFYTSQQQHPSQIFAQALRTTDATAYARGVAGERGKWRIYVKEALNDLRDGDDSGAFAILKNAIRELPDD